jgi:SNF2 family DNA or RNA helicase
MIVDEAHVIKTPGAQKTIAMKNIKAGSHFALTGMWRTFHSKTEVILIE